MSISALIYLIICGLTLRTITLNSAPRVTLKGLFKEMTEGLSLDSNSLQALVDRVRQITFDGRWVLPPFNSSGKMYATRCQWKLGLNQIALTH